MGLFTNNFASNWTVFRGVIIGDPKGIVTEPVKITLNPTSANLVSNAEQGVVLI